MPEPINGAITFRIDERMMTASVIVTEPRYGGIPVNYEQLCSEVTAKGIRHNVNQDALKSIFEQNIFGKSVIIAKGDEPVDGNNGSLVYRFEQTDSPELEEDENGFVDFRNLGFIHNISEGVVIADIIPETTGIPGMDIQGRVIPQINGKPARFKQGNGVALSEDGTKLVSSVAGNLRWNKTHFVVDSEVVIHGDIDASVGNVDFIGNITINGDVKDGYTVRSEGNIDCKGSVTGAKLIAIGNITVKNGVVNSEVEANDIDAHFFENSTITAHGNIVVHSMVLCKVFCTGTITACAGKGTIVGGKITCLSNIETNCLGSDTYSKTYIILGNAAVLAEERLEITNNIKKLEDQIEQLELIVNMLQEQKKAASLTEDREEMLTRTIRGKFVHQSELRKSKKRLKEIEIEIENVNDLKITVKKNLYPGVSIKINNSSCLVDATYTRCTIAMNDNHEIEIKL